MAVSFFAIVVAVVFYGALMMHSITLPAISLPSQGWVAAGVCAMAAIMGISVNRFAAPLSQRAARLPRSTKILLALLAAAGIIGVFFHNGVLVVPSIIHELWHGAVDPLMATVVIKPFWAGSPQPVQSRHQIRTGA
jgi:hypothetical protein